MCVQYIKLKTKNEYGTRYAYVPCGKCADCRRIEQNAWKFRLNAEFMELKKKGWNVAFCTLTYDNAHLPHFPKELFKEDKEYVKIPCFSRTDVREWIDRVRQYCKYHYNFKNENNIRYFVASEYGSNTHRPHYHAILAWPQCVSYEKMHKLVTECWNNGILFPRKPEGEKDILPFEIVGDNSKAFSYVSKYACKDIDLENIIDKYDLKFKHRLMRKCRSFHIQSRSLGFECIKNMTDEQKREVFIHGLSFQGDGQVYKVPLYIKNKIVFDNYYIIDNRGKRMVRRKASAFFERYKEEMFNEKAKFYNEIFTSSISKDWFIKRGVPQDMATRFEVSIRDIKSRFDYYAGFNVSESGMYGKLYLAYFGVKAESCKCSEDDNDLITQWMCRYRKPELNEQLMRGKENLPWSLWRSLQDYFSLVLGCNTYCNLLNLEKRSDDEKLKKKILDYYNNVVKNRLV